MRRTTRYPSLVGGLMIGGLGALAVAIWFLIAGWAVGRPLLVFAALGSAFVWNALTPEDVRQTAETIGGYLAIHLAAFAAFGLIVRWSATVLRRHPRYWLIWLLGFIVLESVVLGTVGTMARTVMGIFGWWTVVIGNAIALAVMGWRAWVAYPVTAHRLSQAPHPRV